MKQYTYKPTLTNNNRFIAPHPGAQNATIWITFYQPIDPAKRLPLMQSGCLFQISEPGQRYEEMIKFPRETICIRTKQEKIVAGTKEMSLYEQPGCHIWLYTSLVKRNDQGDVIAHIDDLTVIW